MISTRTKATTATGINTAAIIVPVSVDDSDAVSSPASTTAAIPVVPLDLAFPVLATEVVLPVVPTAAAAVVVAFFPVVPVVWSATVAAGQIDDEVEVAVVTWSNIEAGENPSLLNTTAIALFTCVKVVRETGIVSKEVFDRVPKLVVVKPHLNP